MKKNEIVIGTSALLVTFRCNLRCKLCCTATPFMEPSKQVDFPIDELKSVITRYFDVVKYIRKLSLGGGEPTLHLQLHDLLEYIVKFRNQIEILEIITNGSMIPRNEILDIAQKYNNLIFFMIDDYGKDTSIKSNELTNIFNKRGIRYSVRCYNGSEAHSGGWVDLGDYSHKHSKTEAKYLLKNCCISTKDKKNTAVNQEKNNIFSQLSHECFSINYVANTNGLIHRCARAYSTLQAGSISNKTDIFVNIMDNVKSIEQIREEVIALFSADSYLACEFCNGFDETSKRYEPAEQLKLMK